MHSLNWHVTVSAASFEPFGLRTRNKHLPRLGLLNLSGLDPPPSGEWTWSLPAGVSLDEASESTPSRSALHWSSYIRSDGMVSCFLSITIIITLITTITRRIMRNWQLSRRKHTLTHTFSLSFRSRCLGILWQKGCCQSSAA